VIPGKSCPHRAVARTVRIGAMLTAISVAACSAPEDPTVCQPVGDNYLQDADFAMEQQNPRTNNAWITLQHAGEPSYTFTIDSGELTISKIGTQPWGIFKQQLRNTDLGGQRMAFTAELKLDLERPKGQAFLTGGGLTLTAKSGRKRILLNSKLNHEPRLGHTDWFPVEVIVDIPDNTQDIELGFILQADGMFEVRNPSFHRVDASSVACAVTPDTTDSLNSNSKTSDSSLR